MGLQENFAGHGETKGLIQPENRETTEKTEKLPELMYLSMCSWSAWLEPQISLELILSLKLNYFLNIWPYRAFCTRPEVMLKQKEWDWTSDFRVWMAGVSEGMDLFL